MKIYRWKGKIYSIKRKGDENMENIKKKSNDVMYKVAKTKDVLNAIKKCNKKYDKAMKNLAR